MPARRKGEEPVRSRRPPARTPEEQEANLINLAEKEAERQIAAGTASSQIITHYLKLGSSREKLEQERLAKELELTDKKIELMESHKNIEKLYAEAIEAMRSYRPSD